jgi:hypothetical protein
MPVYLNTELVTGPRVEPSVWDDLRFPVSAVRLGPLAVPALEVFKKNAAGTSVGVFALFFDDTNEEQVHFAAQMPHAWKLETPIRFHVHWTPKTNGAANQKVNWGLEYTWQKLGGDFSTTTLISGNAHHPADASLVAGRHYLTEIGEIPGTGMDAVSSMLICRLFRDASGALGTDDYADDAILFEADFHYEIDAHGSRLEYTK